MSSVFLTTVTGLQQIQRKVRVVPETRGQQIRLCGWPRHSCGQEARRCLPEPSASVDHEPPPAVLWSVHDTDGGRPEKKATARVLEQQLREGLEPVKCSECSTSREIGGWAAAIDHQLVAVISDAQAGRGEAQLRHSWLLEVYVELQQCTSALRSSKILGGVVVGCPQYGHVPVNASAQHWIGGGSSSSSGDGQQRIDEARRSGCSERLWRRPDGELRRWRLGAHRLPKGCGHGKDSPVPEVAHCPRSQESASSRTAQVALAGAAVHASLPSPAGGATVAILALVIHLEALRSPTGL